MPIYEYRCQDCDHELEAVQRISADALKSCPECGTEGLKRLISQTSFVLKGSGWYATDYAGKKPAESKDTASGSDSSSDKTSDSSSDTTSDSSGSGASDKGSGSSDKGSGTASTSGTDP